MAIMYPPKQPRKNSSEAEKKVYKALQSLSNAYYVVHSVQWKLARATNGQENGECDFLILHPQRGILAIEVKGGDPKNPHTRQNLADADHRQAPNFIKALQDYLEVKGKNDLLALPRGYGIWAPDGDFVPYSGATYVDHVLMASDLAEPAEAIDRLYNLLAHSEPLVWPASDDDIAWLFRQSANLIHPLLRDRLARNAQRQIAQFSQEQEQHIDLLQRERIVAIEGSAGTGKTILAFQLAALLSEQRQRVLFLTFSEVQQQWLRGDDGPKRRKSPFDILCLKDCVRMLFQVAGLNPHEVPLDDINTARPQLRLLSKMRFALNALEEQQRSGRVRYDVIIIDEAQDFLDEVIVLVHDRMWKGALQGSGHFFYFYDPQQRTDLPGPLRPVLSQNALTINLRRNYRNTHEIYALMRIFNPTLEEQRLPSSLDGDQPHAIAVWYFSPTRVFSQVSPPEAEKLALREVLRRLFSEGVAPNKVLVVTCRGRTRSYWLQPAHQQIAGRRLRPINHHPRTADDVNLSTVRSVKGIESDTVILTEVDGVTGTPRQIQLLFTAISRARQNLIILDDAEHFLSLAKQAPVWLVNEVTDGELIPGPDAV